jgi:hypothetical protein
MSPSQTTFFLKVYNSEAEAQLIKFEKGVNFPLNEKLLVIGHQTFIEA